MIEAKGWLTAPLHRNRNADSVVNDPSLGAVFVEPATERMTMDAFFGLLLEAQRRNDSDSDHSDPPSPVYYLQSQNGNLLSELKFLAKDIEVPEFTKEAFGSSISHNSA
jgi:hypothetical protein